MFVRTKTSPNSPRKTVQIVESKRVDGKIRQRIVQHVGVAANEEERRFIKLDQQSAGDQPQLQAGSGVQD